MAVCYRHRLVRPASRARRAAGRSVPDCMTPTPVGMRCPECARERTKVKTIRAGDRRAPVVTQALIAINVIVFIAESATGVPLGGSAAGPAARSSTTALCSVRRSPTATSTGGCSRAGFLHDGHPAHRVQHVLPVRRRARCSSRRSGGELPAVYFASLLAGSFGALLFQPAASRPSARRRPASACSAR